MFLLFYFPLAKNAQKKIDNIKKVKIMGRYENKKIERHIESLYGYIEQTKCQNINPGMGDLY